VNTLYRNHVLAANVTDNRRISLIAASFPHFENVSNLSNAATDIVRAEVLDERVEKFNSLVGAEPGEGVYNLYTVYRIRVLETFQGGTEAGDIIEIRQLGGESEEEVVISEDEVPIGIGDNVVIFMRESIIEGNPAVFLNPQQSVYQVDSVLGNVIDGTISGTIESSHPGNHMSLSFDDLRQIQENNFGNLPPVTRETITEVCGECGVEKQWRVTRLTEICPDTGETIVIERRAAAKHCSNGELITEQCPESNQMTRTTECHVTGEVFIERKRLGTDEWEVVDE
jgi:hypothetical protein